MNAMHLSATRQRKRLEFTEWSGTRIVVAGRSEARLFDVDRTRAVKAAGRLVDTKGRLRDHDLVADRPGRVFDHAATPGARRGAVAHHGTDGERSAHKQQAAIFARRIVAALERDRRLNRFERVVLVAGPSFLGLLREAAKGPLGRMIVREVSTDLLHQPDPALQSRVEALVAEQAL